MDVVSHEPYAALYDRGVAVGWSDIKTDSMHFEFKGEKFTFSTRRANPVATWNGYFYVAPIDKLRELEREAAPG